MKQFISNAADLLKKNSQTGEINILLKDQSWILVDGKNDDEKFHFYENGEVDIEKSHNKEKGSWSFSKTGDELLIKKSSESYSYHVVYIDKSVVLLKKDAHKDDFHYLANVKNLSNLKVEQHLHSVVAKLLHLSLVHVTAGFDLEIHRRHPEDAIGNPGQEVSRDLAPLADGFYQSSTSNFIYEIHESKILRKKHIFKITLSNGASADLYTENKTAYVSVGDNVIVNSKPIPDGKYFMEETWFSIKDGNVDHSGPFKKIKTNQGMVILEQMDSKPNKGDNAYFEGGNAYDGEIPLGLFKKIKVENGKVV